MTWPVDAVAAGVAAIGPHPESGPPAVVWTAGALDQVFPWASVTKLCTALAVLVASEEGTLALDEPAGPPGATIAHLLAHASGLAPVGTGVLAAPGRRRIYSNAGYEVLGAVLSERSGMPFGDYLHDGVLDPLGMNTARLPSAGSPAAGMFGTVHDLLALGKELLAPSLIHRSTWELATTVAFPGLAGVLPGYGQQDPCDWGLGFEVRDDKSPHWTGARNSPATFGHFGRSGGFLWVDPVAGVSCAALTATPFGPWAADAWPALSDAVLEELGRVGAEPLDTAGDQGS